MIFLSDLARSLETITIWYCIPHQTYLDKNNCSETNYILENFYVLYFICENYVDRTSKLLKGLNGLNSVVIYKPSLLFYKSRQLFYKSRYLFCELIDAAPFNSLFPLCGLKGE